MLTSCAKMLQAGGVFPNAGGVWEKALSSIISLMGVFPIKRKFGLVGVFILRE